MIEQVYRDPVLLLMNGPPFYLFNYLFFNFQVLRLQRDSLLCRDGLNKVHRGSRLFTGFSNTLLLLGVNRCVVTLIHKYNAEILSESTCWYPLTAFFLDKSSLTNQQ